MFHVTEKDTSGKLYLMRFWLGDDIVYKVGLTVRKPEERLMDILLSYYKVYRNTPASDIKRFKAVEDVQVKETRLLAALKEFRYTPEKKFSGSSEMFVGIDELMLLDMYDRCVQGQVLGTVLNVSHSSQ